jgi:chemotaxis-related protein WspB
MLFLLFQLGNDRYALDASRVVEVVPLLTLKTFPEAPKGIAGVFNYRGQPVAAVDLCALTIGKPAEERLSTRIIIVSLGETPGSGRLVGLIAEHATEMLRREPSEFVESGIRLPNAPYLGPILMDPHGPIQWVHEQRLISDRLRGALYADNLELSHEAK